MLHDVHCSTHNGYLFIIADWFSLFPKYALKVACLLFVFYFSLLPPFLLLCLIGFSYESCAPRSGGIRGSGPPRACGNPDPGQPSAVAEHPRDRHVHPGGSEGDADDCWSSSELFYSPCPGDLVGLCLLLLLPFGGVPFLLGGCSRVLPVENVCGSSLSLCTGGNSIRSDQSCLFVPPFVAQCSE